MENRIQSFFEKSLEENQIDNELYKKYSVKKGLRNEDGTGVLVGLTKISDVVGYKKVDGEKFDDYGSLYYSPQEAPDDCIYCPADRPCQTGNSAQHRPRIR